MDLKSPRYSLGASGLRSQVSWWAGPPHMNRTMQDFALPNCLGRVVGSRPRNSSGSPSPTRGRAPARTTSRRVGERRGMPHLYHGSVTGSAGADSLVPKRLFLPVELQPFPRSVAVLLHKIRVVERFLLRLDGLVEVACLGVSGGQGVEETAVAVLDHVDGFRRRLDRALAVAELRVGGGGQDAGQDHVQGGDVGLVLEGQLNVPECLVELSRPQVRLAPVVEGKEVRRVLIEKGREFGDRLVVLLALDEDLAAVILPGRAVGAQADGF